MKQHNSTGRAQLERRPSDRGMSGNERIVNRTAQRRKKNKRKKLIIRSAILFLFLCIGVILVLTMFFNINEITVTGDTVYSAEVFRVCPYREHTLHFYMRKCGAMINLA